MQKKLYNELRENTKKGKIYTKDDLTYDILYQLAIVEFISNYCIGSIFGMTANQVKYQRKKYNLSNAWLKRMIDMPESLKIPPEVSLDFNNENDRNLYYETLKTYVKLNEKHHLTIQRFEEYYNEKFNQNNTNDNYKLELVDRNIVKNAKEISKKCKGRKINQTLANTKKTSAGNLGQMIIWAHEKQKMNDLGFSDLIDQVRIVSETQNKNITMDGLGYDVISFNEKREKIYIEVKSSTTIFNDSIDFYISEKERKFICGEVNGLDKDHCFIYYVFAINPVQYTAKYEIIDYKKFHNYELKPSQYHIHEKCK